MKLGAGAMYLEFMVEQPRNSDVAAYLHALLTKSLQLKHCIPNLFYLPTCMKYNVKMKCSYVAGMDLKICLCSVYGMEISLLIMSSQNAGEFQ